MNTSTLKEVQDLIAKGRIDKAINLLIEFCEKTRSDNYREAILLSTQFHIIERKERIGLGEFNQEINRIAQAILAIVMEEKSRNLASNPDEHRADPMKQMDRLEAKLDQLIELLRNQVEDSIKPLEKEYFWRHLEPSSKNYLYSAEKTYTLDELFDYSSVVIQYAKTLESEFLNKVFDPYKNHIESNDPEEAKHYHAEITNLLLKFKERKLSFSAVIRYIIRGLQEESQSDLSFSDFIEKTFFVINKPELVKDLEGIVELRNRAAHVGIITKLEAEQFRDKVFSILRNILNRPYQIR